MVVEGDGDARAPGGLGKLGELGDEEVAFLEQEGSLIPAICQRLVGYRYLAQGAPARARRLGRIRPIGRVAGF